MLVENITVYSTCEHHLLPIVGRAHVAYISNGSVVGLSKMNRIVDYYAKRPQVQERLTIQIIRELQNVLNTKDVACVIDAKRLLLTLEELKTLKVVLLLVNLEVNLKTKKYVEVFKLHPFED